MPHLEPAISPPRALVATAIALAVAWAPTAIAQVSEDIIAASAGDNRILPVDGSPGCGIRLTTETTIGGRQAIPDADCAKRVPEAAEAAAWYPVDGMSFYDALRHRVMHFEEDETALLRSPSIIDAKYYLVPGGADFTRAPTGRTITGAWILSRKGKPECQLTLAPAAVADREEHPLRLGAGCAAAGLPKGIRVWRLEELTVLLEGPDDAQLSLDAVADDRFEGDASPWRMRRVTKP